MRRLNKYCFNRCQPKLSWDPANIFNLRRFVPFDDARLDVWANEWKSRTLTRLYFNGDVTHKWFRHFHKLKGRRDIVTTLCENERRLDNALFRGLWTESIFRASKLVSDGRISVNHQVIRQPSHLLQNGDLVTLDGKAIQRHQALVSRTPWIKFWSHIPAYLEVSYRVGAMVFLKAPEYSELIHPFPRPMIQALGRFYHRYT